jgi:hypothetical protein
MTDELRRAIAEEPSLRGLSRATGINVATLSRFARGLSSMPLDKADTLAAYFGLRIVRDR